MIEGLRSDHIVDMVGGRFKLTSLIQKRWLELMHGARPMVEPGKRTPMEIVVDEILQGKLTIDYEASNLATPEPVKR
jgi:DNA-directed RNA polymerase subunit omega